MSNHFAKSVSDQFSGAATSSNKADLDREINAAINVISQLEDQGISSEVQIKMISGVAAGTVPRRSASSGDG